MCTLTCKLRNPKAATSIDPHLISLDFPRAPPRQMSRTLWRRKNHWFWSNIGDTHAVRCHSLPGPVRNKSNNVFNATTEIHDFSSRGRGVLWRLVNTITSNVLVKLHEWSTAVISLALRSPPAPAGAFPTQRTTRPPRPRSLRHWAGRTRQ